jgi:hypothetical protein
VDLRSPHARCRKAEGNQLELFLQEPVVSSLGWPKHVVRQMLWEHGETEHFVPDYGTLRLEEVSWTLQPSTEAEMTLRMQHGAFYWHPCVSSLGVFTDQESLRPCASGDVDAGIVQLRSRWRGQS